MNKLFKPASLLLYLLAVMVFFIGGLFVAKLTGAGKGQMLAGGAIVLFYGIVAAGLAFITALFVARSASHESVVKINKILGAVVIVLAIIIAYNLSTRQKKQDSNDPLPPKTTAPVDTGRMF